MDAYTPIGFAPASIQKMAKTIMDASNAPTGIATDSRAGRRRGCGGAVLLPAGETVMSARDTDFISLSPVPECPRATSPSHQGPGLRFSRPYEPEPPPVRCCRVAALDIPASCRPKDALERARLRRE